MKNGRARCGRLAVAVRSSGSGGIQDAGRTEAMSLRSDSGTSAIPGTINSHMSAVVVLEHFWRRFGLGTAVVPLLGMLGPSPPPPPQIWDFALFSGHKRP